MVTVHLLNQCNILICNHFSVHIRGVYKWLCIRLCTFLGFAVDYLVCTAQSREHTGIGVSVYSRTVWGGRNVVQVKMLHRVFAFLAVLLSFGQTEDNNNDYDKAWSAGYMWSTFHYVPQNESINCPVKATVLHPTIKFVPTFDKFDDNLKCFLNHTKFLNFVKSAEKYLYYKWKWKQR